LPGCNDDDKVRFTAVVSFGDSISDAGAYKFGTIAALGGGGKFTVNGPNGVALQTAFAKQNLGFMTISLKQQFENHLAKAGGSHFGSDLVTVNSGGNDASMQLTAMGAAFGGGQAAVATGTVAGWPQATLDIVALGGNNAVPAGGSAAVAAMGRAGAELAGYVNTLVVGKGARYVIVRNLGDLNGTTFGATLDPGTKRLITAMSQAFNGQLAAGLAGTAA